MGDLGGSERRTADTLSFYMCGGGGGHGGGEGTGEGEDTGGAGEGTGGRGRARGVAEHLPSTHKARNLISSMAEKAPGGKKGPGSGIETDQSY